ncbi:MAG TPA: hypothetical protein VEW25_05985 [Allosphingosinicella sp.]|nr:hypothetical protein [Allosphingosinicella sp.]
MNRFDPDHFHSSDLFTLIFRRRDAPCSLPDALAFKNEHLPNPEASRRPVAKANPQAASFGTRPAQGITPLTREHIMSRFESIAFSFVAGLAGLLTVATLAPIA